ncbi:MAG: extracellular solute-binding protein [Ruminococcaceae bacterium]|nr:extracellular solute-binding protein [Oscillospiraceae bacterium]
MSKKFKQGVAIALAGMMILLCGCGGNKATVGGTEYDFEVTLAPGYPVDSADVLEWWIPVNKDVTSKYGNLSETPFAQMLKENTGVNINFIHPPQGQESSQFNIVVSSGQMPDIMSYNWATYANGGTAGAVRDNLIIPINTILEKGGAPGLKALLDSDPVWKDNVYTDEGWLPGFPAVGAKSQTVYYGPMIRKDLLDKVGMAVPETVEEMDKVLYAFKDLGVKIPLEVLLGKGMVATNAIAGGFGVFEQKRLTISEFDRIVRDNFEGQEQLRQYIICKIPHYGNDNQEVDALAASLAKRIISLCEEEAMSAGQ